MISSSNNPRLGRAGSRAGNVFAVIVVVTASDIHISPSPVRAAIVATDDNNVVAVRGDTSGSGDVLDGKVGNRDAAGWVAVKVAAIVVLLNENAVPKGWRLVFI